MLLAINWSEFTPVSSLLGGVLIGLASVMLIIFKGRILGVSGIVASLMQIKNTPNDHFAWRLIFLIGLFLSPFIYGLFTAVPEPTINTGYCVLVISGLLVGFGTRMGSGCTSGHAVCGLGRSSTRSLAATITFMISGFATAYFLYHFV